MRDRVEAVLLLFTLVGNVSVKCFFMIRPSVIKHFSKHNLSGLNQWDDIEKLNFFPKLEEVRLQGIPLLEAYTNAERRSLIVAQ